jgi:DNA-binding FrmR family transcriptional regulator
MDPTDHKEGPLGAAVLNRLKRIEGQVRGIMRMVESHKSCEEILVQVSSAKAALHMTGQAILEEHLRHCVVEGLRDGKEEETIAKLTSALNQFLRIG